MKKNQLKFLLKQKKNPRILLSVHVSYNIRFNNCLYFFSQKTVFLTKPKKKLFYIFFITNKIFICLFSSHVSNYVFKSLLLNCLWHICNKCKLHFNVRVGLTAKFQQWRFQILIEEPGRMRQQHQKSTTIYGKGKWFYFHNQIQINLKLCRN